MKTTNRDKRIAEITAEMCSITEFAEGSLSASSNTYKLKDGTIKKAKPHWKFQSLGPRGKRTYKNVPTSLVPKVKKLIENARRYRKLEAEYACLMTEESLAALKKNGRRKLILPRPRLVSVIALIESIQHANTKERREALHRFYEDLSKTVSKDMSTYIGEVMSSVSFRANTYSGIFISIEEPK